MRQGTAYNIGDTIVSKFPIPLKFISIIFGRIAHNQIKLIKPLYLLLYK